MKNSLPMLIAGLAISACLVNFSTGATITNPNQAAQVATNSLLPGGTNDVLIYVWGPISSGTPVEGALKRIAVVPEDGYVIYIDLYPTASHFHPVKYALVSSSTGQVTAYDADCYPANIEDYTEIETEIGRVLKAAKNRRAPLPKDAPPPTRGDRWAVLMNGGINSWSNHVRYWNDLSNIYITLNWTYGFADDHIIVLCSDGLDPTPDQSNWSNSDPDLDGDGDDDIMFPCIPSTVDAVFDSLAGLLSEGDLLFIFTTDHGSSNGGWNTSQNLWNNQTMTDAHFASLLEPLPACTTVCTFEPCYSGGFLDDVVVQPGPIIASSACAYNQVSWAMPPFYEYDTYVFHWTAAVKGEDAYGIHVNADYNSDGVVTMDEAYIYAVWHDFSAENPQYGEYPRDIGESVSLWPTGPAPDLMVRLTPATWPIQIPATGGSFDFSITITNLEVDPANFNCWIDVTLPSGATTDPLMGPVSLEMPGGEVISRDRTQAVPGSAPPGQYTYNAYVGLTSNLIWAQDSLIFEKLGAVDGLGSWSNTGEEFTIFKGLDASLNASDPTLIVNCSPNPFNPVVQITYELTQPQKVHLAIYNTAGQTISVLSDGWRTPGQHEVSFNAESLPSGVYLYHLRTGTQSTSGKIIYLK